MFSQRCLHLLLNKQISALSMAGMQRTLHISRVPVNQNRDEWKAWEGAGLTKKTPLGSQLVYTGPMNKQVIFLGFMAYTVGALGGGMVPVALYNMGFEIPTMSHFLDVLLPPIFGLAMPFALHVGFLHKYVRELYYHSEKDEFMAVVSKFLLRKRKICFKTKDVSTKNVKGFMKDMTSFTAKGHPLIVLSDYFKTPEYFHYLMSQDKPPEEEDPEENNDEKNR